MPRICGVHAHLPPLDRRRSSWLHGLANPGCLVFPARAGQMQKFRRAGACSTAKWPKLTTSGSQNKSKFNRLPPACKNDSRLDAPVAGGQKRCILCGFYLDDRWAGGFYSCVVRLSAPGEPLVVPRRRSSLLL